MNRKEPHICVVTLVGKVKEYSPKGDTYGHKEEKKKE